MTGYKDHTSKASSRAHHVTTIEAEGNGSGYWRDLWEYRELFLVFAWRDIAIRYKQSVLGVGWALIRPLLTMIILTFVFGNVAGLPSVDGAPYALLVMSGTLPWFLFATALGDCSQGLVTNANMIKKIYFPRLMTPLASCCVAGVDFLISFFLLLAMMIGFGYLPDWRILALPPIVAFGLLTVLGPGLLLAALNVRYRDFRFIVPFVVQFGLYIAPVGYSSGVVPEQWRFLYSCNPIVTFIDGFRWCVLRGEVEFHIPGMAISVLLSLFLLYLGLRVFKRAESSFADVI